MFNQTIELSTLWRVAGAVCLTLLVVMLPDFAHAATAFENTMCSIVTTTRGTPAKVVATLAIVFLGIGAFFGKLNWGTALLFAVGIIAIFAAGSIINFLGAGTAGGTCVIGN